MWFPPRRASGAPAARKKLVHQPRNTFRQHRPLADVDCASQHSRQVGFHWGRGPIPGYRGDEFARAQNVTLAVAISQLTCVRRARPPCPREVVTRIGPVTVRQPACGFAPHAGTPADTPARCRIHSTGLEATRSLFQFANRKSESCFSFRSSDVRRPTGRLTNTRSYGLCQCCLGANWPLPASARILPPS
jgi:hypothetical protein